MFTPVRVAVGDGRAGTRSDVESDVVAVGLGVGDVVAADEDGAPGEFDLDDGEVVGLLPGGGGAGAVVVDAGDGLGEAFGAEWLEEVVDGAESEGVDGVVVVGGDEDDGGGVGQAGEDAGDVHAVDAGHGDVEEGRVETARAEQADRFAAAVGADDVADTGLLGELAGEFGAGGGLVFDDEDAEAFHWARTPRA